MTTVKEPVKTYTNVPRPVEAPLFVPQQQPATAPAIERELVPVRLPGKTQGN